jgi:hypothetical protein
VRKLLIALSDLTVVESKTNDPARHSKLGLEEPSAEGATSARVTLQDKGGKTLAALIVGKPHVPKGGGMGTQQLYVRKAQDPQAWLVKGDVELHEDSTGWLDKQILEIKRERVRAVDITHPDGEVLHVERSKPEDKEFVVSGVPAEKDLKYPTVATPMSSALEALNFEDVVPAADVDFASSPGAVARFTTFDGLTIAVKLKEDAGKTYAAFEASYTEPPAPVGPVPTADGESKPEDAAASEPDDEKPADARPKPEDVQKEVAAINARLAPWAFVIPAYNRTSFAKRMADLVKDKAPPPAPVDPNAPDHIDDDQPLLIPGDLPPEIQEQIKKDQEARGNKVIISPPKTPPPADETPKDSPPEEPAPEVKPPAETPPPQTPPQTPPQ